MKQNLPGGSSAVVPPDPMPNSEVKRRSADGSVGSPHARVGNCQASNKWKAPYESAGLFAMRNLAKNYIYPRAASQKTTQTQVTRQLSSLPYPFVA